MSLDFPFKRFLLATLIAMTIGCAGDGGERSPTAPPLPMPELDALCSEYDAGSNGSVDTVYMFTYDSAGFVTRIVGSAGDVADLEYDENHFLLHHGINWDSDPEFEYEKIYTRDPDGRVLTYEERVPGEQPDTETYAYDESGRVIRSVVARDDSGTLLMATTEYVYTGDQLNPTTARLTYPNGATAQQYSASADERMIHIDFDTGEDGVIDYTHDTTLDVERRTVSLINRNTTGVTERHAWTYNTRGALMTYVFADDDNSSPDDWQYNATFTAVGMQTSEQVKSPSGVFNDSIYTQAYKNDCGGSTVAPSGTVVRRVPLRFADAPMRSRHPL